MLKYVHRVHYLVRNRDEMVAYIERNFGLEPERLDYREETGMKNAHYRVGLTIIQLTEPTKPDHETARILRSNGPGVFHVTWAVDDIQQVARELIDKGNTLRPTLASKPTTEGGVHRSSSGAYTTSINPEDSLGVWFQLAEDEK